MKAKGQIAEHFAHVSFSKEGHRYDVGPDKYYNSSVSQYVNEHKQPFEADMIAAFVAKKQTEVRGRYVSKAEILKEWETKRDNAAAEGTLVHNILENYALFGDFPVDSPAKAVQGRMFLDEMAKCGEIPLLCEQNLYSEKLLICGQCDLLTWNSQSGKICLYDYKTNSTDLRSWKSRKYFKPPFDKMQETGLNGYIIQLNLYRMMVQLSGCQVDKMFIVWLKEDEYEIIEVHDMFTSKS